MFLRWRMRPGAMSSANQGFYWWEVDVSFYILKALEKVGLVWELRSVPEHVKKRNLLKDVGERAPLLMKKDGAARSPAATVVSPPEPDLG